MTTTLFFNNNNNNKNNSYYCWCFLLLLVLSSTRCSTTTTTTIITTTTATTTTTTSYKLDDLTALLNDVAMPKSCGSNLQKYKIDLDALWWSKFNAQVKKATHLTHLLNHMISSLNKTSGQRDWQAIVDNIMESNFLESLSYFMLTGGNKPNTGAKQRQDSTTTSELERDYDKFLIGYGVVLDEELMSGRKEAFRCKLIIQNSQQQSKSKRMSTVFAGWAGESQYYVKDEDCSSLNIKEDEDEEKDQNKQQMGGGNVFGKISNSISNQELFKNCLNWYPNLVAEFSKLNVMHGMGASPHAFLNQQLVNKSQFTKSVWCGPYNECGGDEENEQTRSATSSSWILNFHLPLFSSAHASRMKGAVLIKLRINNLDVNQCDQGDPVFARTHKCKLNSECVFAPRGSFGAGNYVCKCDKGFLNSNGVMAPINGALVESEYWRMKNSLASNYTSQFNCVKCPSHECCQLESVIMDEANLLQSSIQNMTSYYYEVVRPSNVFYTCRVYNMTLRIILLAIQIVFILFTLSIAGVIFYFRQNKIVKYSMWILMEITLLGALFLYLTIVIQFFEPNTGTCLALPWFRELGFTIVYGILNLRLYKILVEFQSRKAHVVHIKDNDILRLLSFMTICVLGYLTAWTLVDLDYAHDGFHLVTNTSMKSLVQYPICKIKWWDYFIEMAEFIFVCVGFYLLYCTRTAPSEFNERKFISIVIYCEGIVSTLLHIIKHSIYSSIHPDTVLILYFIRCHTTVTVLLVFVFMTKLLILFKPNSEEYCRSTRLSTVAELGGAPEQLRAESVKFQTGSGGNGNGGGQQQGSSAGAAAGLLNTDYDTSGEFNLTGVKNEEIRAELKRLYTQLYLYKSRSLKADNPHIQAKQRKVAKVAKNSTASSSTTANTRRQSNSLTPSRPLPTNTGTTSIGLTSLIGGGGGRGGGGGAEGESSHMKTPDESICSNDVNVHHSVSYSEDR